jgi:hypothetical protein
LNPRCEYYHEGKSFYIYNTQNELIMLTGQRKEDNTQNELIMLTGQRKEDNTQNEFY